MNIRELLETMPDTEALGFKHPLGVVEMMGKVDALLQEACCGTDFLHATCLILAIVAARSDGGDWLDTIERYTKEGARILDLLKATGNYELPRDTIGPLLFALMEATQMSTTPAKSKEGEAQA